MNFDYGKEPGKRLLNRELINDGAPLVSIITAYYNAGEYFRQTLNCILNQTFPYFEWVIVNDGSTKQESKELLFETGNTDGRIRILHKENGGNASALNMGIRESNTEIIVQLAQDDLIEPTFIERIYWALYCNPEASWAYTDSVGFSARNFLWKKPFDNLKLKEDNFLTYSSGIRKKIYDEIGYYSETDRYYYEDWVTWLKLLAKRKYPVHIEWYGFWYRISDTGVLGTIEKNKKLKERAMGMVKEIGDQIREEIKAVEYPISGEITRFSLKKWAWARKPILCDKKTKLLFIIPNTSAKETKTIVDIIDIVDKTCFEVSVIATDDCTFNISQKFSENIVDVFELQSFLDISDWSAFIDYFIRSRNIDIIFIAGSNYGYYLLPWLRKEHPELIIVDYIKSELTFKRDGKYIRESRLIGEIPDMTFFSNNSLAVKFRNEFYKDNENIMVLPLGDNIVNVKNPDESPLSFEQIRGMENELMTLKAGKGRERRKRICESINYLPNLIEDYAIIYNEFYLKNNTVLAKENREIQLQSEKIKTLEDELQNIKNMRSWQLVEKYRFLKDQSKAGKLLKKLLRPYPGRKS